MSDEPKTLSEWEKTRLLMNTVGGFLSNVYSRYFYKVMMAMMCASITRNVIEALASPDSIDTFWLLMSFFLLFCFKAWDEEAQNSETKEIEK